MVISPNDFSLWARLTGNKYPSTPKERAQKGPEVQNFIQNLGKEGMIGGKEADKKEKKKGLPEKLATGALIAGGVAALGAAARDPRVQDVAQRAAASTRTKIDDFLVNFAPAQDVDVDIVNASGDVTPDPRQQQANVAPQLTGTSAAGRLTSLGSNQVRDPELGLVTFDRSSTPEEINNALTSIKMDRRLDRKAREGNLTATKVTNLAKIKTFVQLVTLSLFLLGLFVNSALTIFVANFFLFLASIITIQTGLSYTMATFKR